MAREKWIISRNLVMLIECQCEGWLTAKAKSIVSFMEDKYPSHSKTPESHAKAYRTGALNPETVGPPE